MTSCRVSNLAAFAAGIILSACGAAAAQTSPAPQTDLGAKPGTLSDKLGRTGGVIKPAGNVDPTMRKTAPQTGTMPVLKPGQVPSQTRHGIETGKGVAR